MWRRICTEKITKRRFTQQAVTHTTHKGAPASIKGTEASCALAANTLKAMVRAT